VNLRGISFLVLQLKLTSTGLVRGQAETANTSQVGKRMIQEFRNEDIILVVGFFSVFHFSKFDDQFYRGKES
jgi:hypothetical protein